MCKPCRKSNDHDRYIADPMRHYKVRRDRVRQMVGLRQLPRGQNVRPPWHRRRWYPNSRSARGRGAVGSSPANPTVVRPPDWRRALSRKQLEAQAFGGSTPSLTANLPLAQWTERPPPKWTVRVRLPGGRQQYMPLAPDGRAPDS
jgi:hypothetical protein